MPFSNPPQLPDSHSLFPIPGITPKLHLFTRNTPNGQKVASLLEALREAYPKDERLCYDYTNIRLDLKEQKTPESVDINSNGMVPALVDDNVLCEGNGEKGNEKGGHKVFKSVSIMLWLVERYDPKHKFWFKDEVERSTAMSWIFFGHGGEFL
jgi:glutathione S-transferase